MAENNLVYNTTHGGFHQHYGRENTIRNNIFALGRDAQIQRRARAAPRFTFQGNIVYYRSGELLSYVWSGGIDRITLDHNLYWNADGSPPPVPGRRSRGLAEAGLRQAFPRRRSAVRGPDHDVFQPEGRQPGRGGIGFRPLDLASVGPTHTAARCDFSLEVTRAGPRSSESTGPPIGAVTNPHRERGGGRCPTRPLEDRGRSAAGLNRAASPIRMGCICSEMCRNRVSLKSSSTPH